MPGSSARSESRLAVVGAVLAALAVAAPVRASTSAQVRAVVDTAIARRLLSPDSLPADQFGMAVESVDRGEDGAIVIATTGATFELDPGTSTLKCHQRLGRARPVATIGLPAGAAAAEILGQTRGAVLLQTPLGRWRFNADSLVMFAPDGPEPFNAKVRLHLKPQWNQCAGANWLKLDNYGGVGIYVIGRPREATEPGGTELDLAIAPGEHGELLWISIAPPRPFRWEESLEDRYFSYWTDRADGAFPGATSIAQWKEQTRLNVLVLQSEVMNWKQWQLAFEPRAGDEALRGTLRAAHDLGVRVLVYTSPLYFTRSTPVAPLATESFVPGRPRFGPGWPWGDNLDLFLAEIERLVGRFEVDGLYFDGVYDESLVQSYRLVREARRLLGPDRRLMLHTTWGPPFQSMAVFCPAIDTYANVVYRGENMKVLAANQQYLRYAVSGYHIGNAVGAPVHDAVPAEQLDDRFANALLDVNARLLYHGNMADPIRRVYWPALADAEALRQRVDRALAERQAALDAEVEQTPGARAE